MLPSVICGPGWLLRLHSITSSASNCIWLEMVSPRPAAHLLSHVPRVTGGPDGCLASRDRSGILGADEHLYGGRVMATKIDRIQPAGMNVRIQQGKPAYSHVVTVTGPGKTIYIAGQLARDAEGNIVGPGDTARTDLSEPRRLPQGRWCDLGRCCQDQHLRHGLPSILPMLRRAHALFRGSQSDQHHDPDRRSRSARGDG